MIQNSVVQPGARRHQEETALLARNKKYYGMIEEVDDFNPSAL
jgi:hypothetical protein